MSDMYNMEGDVNYDPYNGNGEGGGEPSLRPGHNGATVPLVKLPPAEETAGLRLAGVEYGSGGKAVAKPSARAEAVAGTDRQIRTIQDWMEAEENRPETEEERVRREKKERSKRIVAAVSDGLSALGNVFFASRYAPNMYDHAKGSQLNAANDRIGRMKAEREKKRDQYMAYSLKLGDLENERARTLRELEAQREAQRLARLKEEREAEQHAWAAALQSYRQREQAGKADKAEQEAVKAGYEAVYAPALQDARLATERERAGSYRASAANSYASAGAHGRSHQKEFYGTGKDGKERSFASEKAAIDFERRQGTYDPSKWGHDEVEITTVTGNEGSMRGKTTRKRKVRELADPTADTDDKDDPTA